MGWFLLCLINLQEGDIAFNYIFVFTPLLAFITSRNFSLFNAQVHFVLVFSFFIILFFLGLAFKDGFELERRIFSFLIFMSIFILPFDIHRPNV